MMAQVEEIVAPGWVLTREGQPGLESQSPLELLEQTAALPGTFRLARVDAQKTCKIGEVREECDLSRPVEEPTPDLIESLLEEHGQAWKRREPGWVIPASARSPLEVVLTPYEEGWRIEAVLMSWDEITPVQKEALAAFLCRAQAGLRFARCELSPLRAVVAANLASGDVEAGLEYAIAAVQSSGRRLQREVGALVSDELATEYLRFFPAGRS